MDLFQERYRELPSFQLALKLVQAWVKADMSLEEVATRVLMFQESPLNWDTMCHNCAALMDNNYEFYLKTVKLQEEIDDLKLEINALNEDLAYEMNESRALAVELGYLPE